MHNVQGTTQQQGMTFSSGGITQTSTSTVYGQPHFWIPTKLKQFMDSEICGFQQNLSSLWAAILLISDGWSRTTVLSDDSDNWPNNLGLNPNLKLTYSKWKGDKTLFSS